MAQAGEAPLVTMVKPHIQAAATVVEIIKIVSIIALSFLVILSAHIIYYNLGSIRSLGCFSEGAMLGSIRSPDCLSEGTMRASAAKSRTL